MSRWFLPDTIEPCHETVNKGRISPWDFPGCSTMQIALKKLREQGGKITYGGQVLSGGIFDTGTYVTPCIAEARADMPIVHEETFAPIRYVIRFRTLEEAVVHLNKDKEIELDCSKNCKSVVQACEAEGRSRDECENRYNQCVSNCTLT